MSSSASAIGCLSRRTLKQPATREQAVSNTTIRQQITEQIIQAVERGVKPWVRPWSRSKNSGRPANVVSKNAYNGVNPLILELHRQRHRLQSRWYGTFRQWSELGFTVKQRPADVEPGQWGAHIVYFRPIIKTKLDPATGDEKEDRFFLLKSYVVFSADQVEGDGVERFRVTESEGANSEFADFEPVERLLENSKADIRFFGDRAYYNRTDDYIVLPPKRLFHSTGEFYATALHEGSHWSEKRIGWDHEKNGYPLTELVAEISASFVAAELGVPNADKLDNHASYVANWLEAMRGDSSYIFRASTAASKSANFLLSFVKQEAASLESAIIV
jgi:antirestriction protein ArdC